MYELLSNFLFSPLKYLLCLGIKVEVNILQLRKEQKGYSYIETEAVDRKSFSKGEIKLKLVMAGHIFDLNIFRKTILGNVFMILKNN